MLWVSAALGLGCFFVFLEGDTVNRGFAFPKPLAGASTNGRCKRAMKGRLIVENLHKNREKGKLLSA